MVETGKIEELIAYIKKKTGKSKIIDIPASLLLETLCQHIGLETGDLDDLIANNSPVFRSIKGHSFETLFQELMNKSNTAYTEVGGDQAVDLIVNKHSLQLKTPTLAGTKGDFVQYKTHKTHGAKSEKEGLSYYHHIDDFADFLVGLVSYKPLQILILSKKELPRHPSDKNLIKSPFEIKYAGHIGLNNWSRIGLSKVTKETEFLSSLSGLLPLTEKRIGVNASVILHTIFKLENFRVWDMLMRGFAREVAFQKELVHRKIKSVPPLKTGKVRGNKCDFALAFAKGAYKYFQVKGPSIGACSFGKGASVIAVETQLTRGRVNDHPTQSRLYQVTDFDFLLVGLDPCVAALCGGKARWEFYAIPSNELKRHKFFTSRYKSMQKWNYQDMQKHLITEDWYNQWLKTS